MKFSNSPTERQVIRITILGGKGKTFFQKYAVVGYYRQCRAARLDLRVKHANAYNLLKKTLTTIDIFLNDVRSQSGEDLNLYRLLEDIKDGQATTAKYNNDNIQFKTLS